jgi:hypothetical protein
MAPLLSTSNGQPAGAVAGVAPPGGVVVAADSADADPPTPSTASGTATESANLSVCFMTSSHAAVARRDRSVAGNAGERETIAAAG